MIIVGALLLILGAFVLKDMVDYNWYTWGNVALIIIGFITHIVVNKRIY